MIGSSGCGNPCTYSSDVLIDDIGFLVEFLVYRFKLLRKLMLERVAVVSVCWQVRRIRRNFSSELASVACDKKGCVFDVT